MEKPVSVSLMLVFNMNMNRFCIRRDLVLKIVIDHYRASDENSTCSEQNVENKDKNVLGAVEVNPQ